MDFQVTQTSRNIGGKFLFIALSDAAKRYIVGLTGESKVSFSRDAEDLMPAVKDILSENLTIQIQ